MGEAKFNGNAREVEMRAEKVNDEQVPDETVGAVETGQSMKRTAETGSQGRFKRAKIDADDERPKSRHAPFRVKDTKPEKHGRVPDDEGLGDVPPSTQRFVSPKTNSIEE